MKKIFVITFLGLGIIYSCGDKVETPTEPEKTQELENDNSLLDANIDLLSDTELLLLMDNIEANLIDNKSLEMSKQYSVKLLETSKKHLEKFPESPERRDVIRKASKAAQGLNQDYEAIRLLDMSIKENSMDTTIVEEMNVRAYLFDKINDMERAEKAYKEIIEKYPNHSSVKMHKERLKTIHLSEDELLKYFQEKNAK
ncbi:MAG: tetratricopeptide repeat protein [Flavobacteriales bacterium]